eukprot:gene16547-biopygen10159
MRTGRGLHAHSRKRTNGGSFRRLSDSRGAGEERKKPQRHPAAPDAVSVCRAARRPMPIAVPLALYGAAIQRHRPAHSSAPQPSATVQRAVFLVPRPCGERCATTLPRPAPPRPAPPRVESSRVELDARRRPPAAEARKAGAAGHILAFGAPSARTPFSPQGARGRGAPRAGTALRIPSEVRQPPEPLGARDLLQPAGPTPVIHLSRRRKLHLEDNAAARWRDPEQWFPRRYQKTTDQRAVATLSDAEFACGFLIGLIDEP